MQDRTKTYLVRPKLSRIETKRTKLALIQTRSKRKRSSVSSRIEAKKKLTMSRIKNFTFWRNLKNIHFALIVTEPANVCVFVCVEGLEGGLLTCYNWLVILRLAVTLFSRIFTGEGTIWYMGCDSTHNRTKRLKARAVTLIGILPCLGEGKGQGFMFCTLIEA